MKHTNKGLPQQGSVARLFDVDKLNEQDIHSKVWNC